MAAKIRDRFDWQTFKAIATLTGDGAALTFAFPTNYARMLKEAKMWPSASPNTPYTHYLESDDWLAMLTQNFSAVVGAWTIYGDLIHVRVGGSTSPIALADTAQFFYINNLQFASAAGAAQATILADTDVFRLTPERSVGERILRLGFIRQWKSDNGRPYAQDEADYEDALAIAMGNDKGAKGRLVVGRRRSPSGIEFALPWGV